ncbi:MAG TPA: hypothetical protein DEB46_02440 [Myxococcales bacterium]|nr:hypothetical protein [Myxococcales bacterium]HBU47147.1 hypothetical protein [Myxococcales bacterium]
MNVANLPLWLILAIGGIVSISALMMGMRMGRTKGYAQGRRVERRLQKKKQRRAAERAESKLETSEQRKGHLDDDRPSVNPDDLELDAVMPLIRDHLDEILLRLEGEGVYSETETRKELIWKNSVLDAYVGKHVLHRLERERKGKALIAGQLNIADAGECTILFMDLRGFTAVTQQLGPSITPLLINYYLKSVTRVIHTFGGTVDKFIGDCVMATWGLPHEHPTGPLSAVQCGRAMVEAVETVNSFLFDEIQKAGLRVTEEGAVKKKSKKKNTGEDRAEYERKLKGVAQKLLHPSIGIATGIVAGLSMGGPERRSYSVIGKAVNRAARLESATRKENCDLLIDNETYEIIKQEMAAADMKRADLRDLKGLGYRQAWQWSRSTVGSLHDPDAPISVDPL